MSRMLDALKEYVDTLPFDIIRASEIYRGGEIETLEYSPANPCQDCYSIAKAFTATAVGFLYDRGLLSPEDKICDIMADDIPDGTDERWYDNTVDRALTHRLGLPGGFLDVDCVKAADFGEDYLRYLFLHPFAVEPGVERYSDGAYYLLSCVVEKVSGMPLDNFLWKELALPMEFQQMAFSRCPKGHAIGATGLFIHSSDAVKLAELYLNEGVYRGRRYLSEEWCRMAFERDYSFDRDDTGTVYYKGGMCGQKLMCFTEQRRAVCVQSSDADSDVLMKFIRDGKFD